MLQESVMLEQEQRELVVKEARSWIGTPYHLGGHVKRVGVDCAQLVATVYKTAGIVPANERIGIFSHDWFHHTTEQRYLLRLLRYTRVIAETEAYRSTQAQPGDLVLTAAAQSRIYNHAGIVIAWPSIVHAIAPHVQLVDALTNQMWSNRKIVILSPWNRPQDNTDSTATK